MRQKNAENRLVCRIYASAYIKMSQKRQNLFTREQFYGQEKTKIFLTTNIMYAIITAYRIKVTGNDERKKVKSPLQLFGKERLLS